MKQVKITIRVIAEVDDDADPSSIGVCQEEGMIAIVDDCGDDVGIVSVEADQAELF